MRKFPYLLKCYSYNLIALMTTIDLGMTAEYSY